MEISYSQLKCKQVINVVDGKCLGRVIDVVLDVKSCKILGLVVPNPTCNMWSLFKSGKEIFVPFHCICKIGIDVILVELYIEKDTCYQKPPPPKNNRFNNCNTWTLNNNDYKVK